MNTDEICGLPAQSMLILCGELLSTMAEELWVDTLEDWGICEYFPSADREIVYMNDDWGDRTPEQRHQRMRKWVASLIKE